MTEATYVKVNVQVPKDLHDDLTAMVPWGLRRHLVGSVLRLVVDAAKRDGPIVFGALMAGRFTLEFTDQEGVPNRDMPLK